MSEHEQMTEHHIADDGTETVRQICANCCTVSKDEYGHYTVHRDADWPCPSMQLAAANERAERLERACYQEVPEGGPFTFSGFGCLLCGWDCSQEFPEMHEPSCLLYGPARGDGGEGK